MKAGKSTEKKVFSYLREHHMLVAGDRVVAGISGGADSVCLLFVMLEWAKETPLEIKVVHVNHGIRRESGGDAAFVEQLCARLGVPFCLKEADVPERARREKCSLEEAGRRARYEAFLEVAREFGGEGTPAKIAVAHNSNDNSETMLFHLFRGSGIRGLGGIPPMRDNIIRPLLCLERREIEAYLKEKEEVWCQDDTNASDAYTRNRLRNHIFPYVEKEIVQGAVSHMAQTAGLLREAEDYLEAQTREAQKRCVTDVGTVKVSELLKEHPLLQKRLLHEMVKELSPHQRDISHRHILDLLDLFTGEGNRRVDLPFGIRGRRVYGVVILERILPQETGSPKERVGTDNRSEKSFSVCEGWKTEFEMISAGDFYQKNTVDEYTKCFDYDKIKELLIFRPRQPGDYLILSDGCGGMMHKSLKSYMIDQKIPKEERDHIPVLAEGNHVLWIAGYRSSEYYRVDQDTKQILQVKLIKTKM